MEYIDPDKNGRKRNTFGNIHPPDPHTTLAEDLPSNARQNNIGLLLIPRVIMVVSTKVDELRNESSFAQITFDDTVSRVTGLSSWRPR
jgi:hypothetical protein